MHLVDCFIRKFNHTPNLLKDKLMNHSSPLGSTALEGQGRGLLTVQDPRWRTTFSRTPLIERSACRRDLYLTTHKTKNVQTSMPPAGLESTFPVSERPQTHALDRTATGNTNEPMNSAILVTHAHYEGFPFDYVLRQHNRSHLQPQALFTDYQPYKDFALYFRFRDTPCTTCLPAITVTCPDQSSSLL
jgi:hypothetical protein